MAGEIDRLSGSHGLVGGEHDGQARETVLQVRGQVELLANRAHEELLFAPAELIVTGLVRLRQPFVRAGKATGWCQLCMMHANGIGADVVFHLGRRAVRVRVNALDRYRAARPDHVFDEECGLAHHRPPSGLVPAHRAIAEDDLQLAVVTPAVREARVEAGSDGRNSQRPGCHHIAALATEMTTGNVPANMMSPAHY
jgi:hypothetical protein